MTSDDDAPRLRATAHPLRLRILSLLTGTAMSAAELARELGITPGQRVVPPARLVDAGEVVAAARRRSAAGSPSATGTPGTAAASRKDATAERPGQHVRAMGQELEPPLGEREPRTRALITDAESGWHPRPGSGCARLVEEASSCCTTPSPAAPHRRHRARQPHQLAAFRMDGRVMTDEPTALAPLREPNFRYYFLSRAGQPGRHDDGPRRAGVRGARGQRLPDALGIVLAAHSIPMVLFLLAGGVIADRFGRTLVIQVSNVAVGHQPARDRRPGDHRRGRGVAARRPDRRQRHGRRGELPGAGRRAAAAGPARPAQAGQPPALGAARTR